MQNPLRITPAALGGLLLVALCMVGIAAQGDRGQPNLERRFDELDADDDGELVPRELPRPAIFAALDLDRDGRVTRPEARRAVAAGALKAAQESPAVPATSAIPVAARPATVRQGPQPLLPGDHGVGRLVPAATFAGIDGRAHVVGRGEGRFTIFAMTSTSCPLSAKYLPTLARLAAAAAPGFRFVLVNPIATDADADLRTAADRCGRDVVYVHDRTGSLAAALGATTTTDVVVIDARRTVVYHGAIDDQYGFGYALDTPRRNYLADALKALAAGGDPPVAATDAPGCELERPSGQAAVADVTYHGRVSRILQRHCVECHREGGVGPFPLDSPEDVVAHAAMIRTVVERGTMPPWFAAPEPAPAGSGMHSPWANDRSLADAERRDLLAWLAGGRPLGNPADAAAPREFPRDWQIGEPDAVYGFAEPVAVKATGVMPYQHVFVDTGLAEDRWVRAIEVQPGNRDVVHHVLVHVVGGDAEEGGRDAAADERRGFWAEYVPGQNTLVYPDGFAKRLPKGARLRFQMHYTPNGTATTDTTRIGVIFASERPRHEVRVAGIVNPRITIPPGAGDHREEASLRLPHDATIMGFLPHMHVRGKAARYELVRRDGTTTTLLDVPRYDFNWQLLYRYHEPLPLSAGDVLRFTAWYDNSAANPANPDPSRTVRWGPQTFDEMHLGYVEYFIP